MSGTVRQRVQRGLAIVLVALAGSNAGATTASFLGELQVTFKGRADDGTQRLKYEGIAQDSVLAGQAVKGKVKLRFSGDRL